MRSNRNIKSIFCIILALLMAACSHHTSNESSIPQVSDESIANNYESEETVSLATNGNTTSDEIPYYILTVKAFSEGVAWVEVGIKEDEMVTDSRWVCIDANASVLFMLDFDAFNPSSFENGVALYKTNDGEYIVDKSGNVVFSSRDGLFDGIIAYDNGFLQYIVILKVLMRLDIDYSS